MQIGFSGTGVLGLDSLLMAVWMRGQPRLVRGLATSNHDIQGYWQFGLGQCGLV